MLAATAPSLSTWGVAAGAAAVIAVGAWRARSLSTGGALAAMLTGTVAMATSWSWGTYLVAWFVSASLLSRVGRAAKQARTGDVVEKGDQRDAGQVVANGGVFAVSALAALLHPEWTWPAFAGAGALAAAGADTAATEIGTLWGGTPWSLRTRAQATPGSSGAVSMTGSVGMLGAAAVLGLLAALLRLVPWGAVAVIAYAGLCGALADTVLGAWLQARRWCPACERETEQPVHRCGTTTVAAGGLAWLTNDRVNLLCTVVGAGVAVALR